MSLPDISVSRDTILVEGNKVPVRGLTRGENAQVSRLIDAKKLEEAEILILAKGTDTPEDEARNWYAETNSGVVDSVLRAIQALTGLSSEDSKSSS